MKTNQHVVARREELVENGKKIVNVEGREIGIFHIDGEYYAVRNSCPDQGGPICQGGLFENFKARVLPNRQVEEYIEDRGYILACPWHGWEFDVRTGVCLWSDRYRVRTYPVFEDAEGNIVIEL